jgi:nicotinate-nucleotide adenylyltransferase
MKREETVVFGGSFNPPHRGHRAVIEYIAERYARVVVVPCAKHAFNKDLVSFDHRFIMCQLLSAKMQVLDIEQSLNLSGYTVDTLRTLQHMAPLRLAVGADVLGEADRWHKWDEIERIAPPLVIAREGFDDGGRAEIPAVPGSSTQVRERLAQGESIDDLVPHAVVAYIEQHSLYQPA